MDILQSTHDYEKWMAEHIHVVAADLRYKHVQMKGSLFAFLMASAVQVVGHGFASPFCNFHVTKC